MAQAQDITRIILATDGDFNLGISDPEDLRALISKHRDSGIYLSVLGFGRGNLDDATLQALAQNGNGQAAYIDSLSEAQKVLVDQLDGALFPIANDVKVQIEFNPAQVAEYRLIGYETRALRRADFNNDKVDAGDIGAGHQVTALYEITPVGSPARMTEPLRYGSPISQNSRPEIAFVKLRYKRPGETQSQRINAPVGAPESSDADDDLRFAAAIAGFGQLLRDPRYLGTWSWGDAIRLAEQARGADRFGYRAEAILLMRLAQSLSLP
jgi:Ca-activated chloride channel family protein